MAALSVTPPSIRSQESRGEAPSTRLTVDLPLDGRNPRSLRVRQRRAASASPRSRFSDPESGVGRDVARGHGGLELCRHMMALPALGRTRSRVLRGRRSLQYKRRRAPKTRPPTRRTCRLPRCCGRPAHASRSRATPLKNSTPGRRGTADRPHAHEPSRSPPAPPPRLLAETRLIPGRVRARVPRSSAAGLPRDREIRAAQRSQDEQRQRGDAQAAARLSSADRCREFAVRCAARSNSARASSGRPSLSSRSPRALGSRW
jgi:hypothetical protein